MLRLAQSKTTTSCRRRLTAAVSLRSPAVKLSTTTTRSCSCRGFYNNHNPAVAAAAVLGYPCYFSKRSLSSSSNSSSSGTWNWKNFGASGGNNNNNNENNETGNGGDNSSGSSNNNKSLESQVLKKSAELYMSLMPLNEKLRGPLEHQQHSPDGGAEGTLIGNNTLLPFVFLVGNHSSGKSSFINYVMGRDVQTAGVAPTDDCFTIITAGPEDTDQDGPALIFGNPALGFSNLSQFGPTLIHHTQLKVRNNIRTTDFMMVDSPGMIDSPASMGGMLNTRNNDGSPGAGGAAIMDRGYDFPGVVRWFAERADVVLLFFDPDKPGTTGETLSILLHSLGGMDHKMLIVLNKADQFEKIHDFARAYGSLCWNLSKVIPRKDLPRIFTMCLPVEEAKQKLRSVGSGDIMDTTTTTENDRDNAVVLKGGLSDLYATKDEVVAEVMKAPKRRVDNVITHLYDSVCVLRMHTRICQDLRQRYNLHYWDCKYQELGLTTTSLGAIGAIWYAGHAGTMATAAAAAATSSAAAGAWSMEAVLGSVVAASIFGIGGLGWYNGVKLRAHEKNLMSTEGLSASFQTCYRREIREADEYVASLWQRIKEPLQSSLEQMGGLSRMPSSPSINYDREVERLSNILEQDIPSLRRIVSPATTGSSRKYE